MGRLAEFLKEITPAWIADKARLSDPADGGHAHMPASDADRAWRESADKNLFGADTPDYTYVAADELDAAGTHSASEAGKKPATSSEEDKAAGTLQ